MTNNEQRIFISWSGNLARDIAVALQKWLKDVLQPSTSFVSSEDISKGTFWSARILDELASCRSGIIVITPDNFKAPWLNFEAGALVNRVTEAGSQPVVCPLLIDVEPSSLPTPMSLLQVTKTDLGDLEKMVLSLNSTLSSPLDPETVKRSVERWFDDLNEMVSEAKGKHTSIPPAAQPTTAEMLSEVLELTRAAASERAKNPSPRASGLTRRQLDQDVERSFDYLVRNFGSTSSAEAYSYEQWLQTGRFHVSKEEAYHKFAEDHELWIKVRLLSSREAFRDAIERRWLTKHDIAELGLAYGLAHSKVDAGSTVQIMMRHVKIMESLSTGELDSLAGVANDHRFLGVSTAFAGTSQDADEDDRRRQEEDNELRRQLGLPADG